MAFKPPATLPDYTKLITSLNASGVQSWNPELHSILKQLISSSQQSQDAVTGVPAGSSVGVINIGGDSGGGTEIDYSGNYIPTTYNDGDIVVATDGIAYLCVKDGTTTPPEPWPGGGGITGPAGPAGPPGPQGPPGTIGPHHTTHEPGGTDALVNAAWTNLANVFTAAKNTFNGVTFTPTGTQVFEINSNPCTIHLISAGSGLDGKRFDINNGGSSLNIIALSDDQATIQSQPITAFRDGSVKIGTILNVTGQLNAPSAIISGPLTANSITVTTTVQAGGLGSTPLNASNLTTGTVPDARLSTNVALLNQANTFTQDQTLNKTSPILKFFDTAQPANLRGFRIFNDSQLFHIESISDTGTLIKFAYFDRSLNFITQGTYTESNRTTPMGYWIDIPFNAANFSATGGMIWTVDPSDQLTYAYTLIGKTAFVSLFLQLTSISGTLSPILNVSLPFICTKSIVQPIMYNDSTWKTGFVQINAGSNFMQFINSTASNWSTITNSLYITCQIAIPI